MINTGSSLTLLQESCWRQLRHKEPLSFSCASKPTAKYYLLWGCGTVNAKFKERGMILLCMLWRMKISLFLSSLVWIFWYLLELVWIFVKLSTPCLPQTTVKQKHSHSCLSILTMHCCLSTLPYPYQKSRMKHRPLCINWLPLQTCLQNISSDLNICWDNGPLFAPMK